MKFRSMFFFVFASTFVLGAFAAKEDVVVVKRSTRELYEDSSEANRLNKEWSLTYSLLGLSPNFSPSPGFSLGYHLDRNQQVIAEIRSGKGTFTRQRWESSNGVTQEFKTDAQINQIGVHYKRFTGNSFYFRTGLDYGTVDYKFDLSSSFFTDDRAASSFSSKALIGSFVIGNQWQWENFTLGCDWVGIAAPITYQISSRVPETGSTFDESAKRDFEDDKKAYVSSSSPVLLRFYLGASF